MSDIQWTPDQLHAITNRAPRILVSAAAGSGKTTVLTERIIRRISDEANPLDISQMLIVTFTKAATADLKDQIAAALTAKLAEKPTSKHLSRQLALLPSAQISTIHSFCYTLIRMHFQQLSLPSSLRVADENEGRLLSFEVMEQLLQDLYEGTDTAITDFSLLVDQFVSIDDKSLGEQLRAIYDKLLSFPNGLRILDTYAARYDTCRTLGFMDSEWGQILQREIADAMTYFSAVLHSAQDYLREDATAAKKYGDALSNDVETTDRLLALLQEKNWTDAQAVIQNFRPVSIKSTKYADPPLCISDFVLIHKQLKSYLDNLREKGGLQISQQIGHTAEVSIRLLRALSALLTEFDRRFTQEKRRRGILDYNDLEREALRLLISESGQPTPLAHALSNRYREIYIDEYQDVNEVQDLIFSAAGVDCQRFMVGDIKQSIYAFRGSAPHLFARYRQDPRFSTIFLAENFRSDRGVIDFCNAVFDFLFPHGDPAMPYTEKDALVCGKSEERQKSIPVQLSILKNAAGKTTDEQGAPDPEAAYVAEQIDSLLHDGYQPGDIAILLRSPSSHAQAFEDALAQRGIACTNQDKKSLLENEEVLLLLSLLKVIDNPRRDIDLAAVLRSPLYGMTMDDLIHIRASCEGTLYEALQNYTEENRFEAGVYFFEKLKEYRRLAVTSPVDRLIWILIEDTGMTAFRISDQVGSGQANRANLLMFYDYARTFASGSFQGLSNFLKYISEIMNSESTGKFRAPEIQEEQKNTVRILSIHASKGLQFPVCFVCGTGHAINCRDADGNFLMDRNLGIALKLSDETGFAHYETPFRFAASRAIRARAVQEEMRVLYVALTRAKERLIVTGAVSDPDALQGLASCIARNCTEGCRYPLTDGKPTYLRWILSALYASGYHDYSLSVFDPDSASAQASTASAPIKQTSAQEEQSAARIEEYKQEICRRYSFQYPYQALSAIPAKVTVSQLHPDLLDPENDGQALFASAASDFAKPRFLEGEHPTAADRGTATHLFMQFCDFSSVTQYTVEREIKRLVDQHFFSKATASLINRKALNLFFSSPLFSEMKKTPVLRREIRFHSKFPAARFVNEPGLVRAWEQEDVLVQGVIDCYYITSDGKCVLIDYKTDRIPEEYLGDPEKEDGFLAERHTNQLRYYSLALEKMLCRRVDQVLLWSFSLGRTVDLTSLCCDDAES